MIDSKYFKEYRNALGFTNQSSVKKFFGAKDVLANIDLTYIKDLNYRLKEIVEKINSVSYYKLSPTKIEEFTNINIQVVFQKLADNGILPKLNNQGRRTEDVYFSWMRGFVVSSYFTHSLSQIFMIKSSFIQMIGDDDLKDLNTFKRTPKADLEITIDNEKIRVEIQSGFQGNNDIKQHKVLEAKRVLQEEDLKSILIHFDLFNGQVAFVRLDNIQSDDINWITRQQMEGQTVFNIEQNYFKWKLIEKPPFFDELEIL